MLLNLKILTVDLHHIFQVPEGETVVLTTSHLSFTDRDTHPSLIVYQITEPLPAEQGYLEFNDDPQIPITRCVQVAREIYVVCHDM